MENKDFPWTGKRTGVQRAGYTAGQNQAIPKQISFAGANLPKFNPAGNDRDENWIY